MPAGLVDNVRRDAALQTSHLQSLALPDQASELCPVLVDPDKVDLVLLGRRARGGARHVRQTLWPGVPSRRHT